MTRRTTGFDHRRIRRLRTSLGCIAADPDADDFDEFVGWHVNLMDKHLLNRFWTPEVVNSGAARAAWVEPDREPLTLSRNA